MIGLVLVTHGNLALEFISAMQHVVGITNSDKIIAINTDKDAPIMKLADIAINNDAISTLNKLLNIDIKLVLGFVIVLIFLIPFLSVFVIKIC